MKILRIDNWSSDYQKLDEGAWGYEPLDNDTASDWKWRFGNMIYEEIMSSLENWMEENDLSKIYNAIGMWEYFRNKHIDDSYGIFVKKQIEDLDYSTTQAAYYLLKKYKEMDLDQPEKVKQYLEKFIEKIS